jgi:hypothetical protein
VAVGVTVDTIFDFETEYDALQLQWIYLARSRASMISCKFFP